MFIAINHAAYDSAFIVNHSRLVVDPGNATWTVTRGREKIVRA